MTDAMIEPATPEEPAAELVEAFAKRLFRNESPPNAVWDLEILEQTGASLEHAAPATEEIKDAYRRRAHQILLDATPAD
jgi:hypothetical protein